MNTKLEDLFNLPKVQDCELEVTDSEPSVEPALTSLTSQELDKIDQALPAIRDLSASDREMDEISALAEKGYKDLMELGMQVEVRHAGEIFGVASNLLGHSLTARKAKIDKKLKMIDLQIRKMRMDQLNKPQGAEIVEIAQATVLDRNALINEILEKSNKQSNS